MKVKDLNLEIARQLDTSIREILRNLGYAVSRDLQTKTILLQKKRGPKVRWNASPDSWSPGSGAIEIRFVAEEQKQMNAEVSRTKTSIRPAQPQEFSGGISNLQPAEADLLKALDRVESRPGWSFVPLKKFRDEILPLEKFASTEIEQRNALDSVIKRKFVVVGKVPNPRSPQFPVTTIRLNRLMPEVKAALGRGDNSDLEFRPVEIPGEPLSTTILRERR